MSKCKGCGKEIVWGQTMDGKKIPLDPKPPVYRLAGNNEDGTQYVSRDKQAMVTHFATCSAASQFSGRNKDAKRTK